jgi:hypothetical protein
MQAPDDRSLITYLREAISKAGTTGSRAEIALVVAVSIAGCAAMSLLLGPDINWDLRNYHLYVAWAWLEDRHGIDIAAAQAQTWFNPLLWVPHFLLFERLDGSSLVAVVGGLHGLCAWPLLRIAQSLLPTASLRIRAFATLTGLGCATFVGQLGTSFGDNLIALLLLSGIAALVRPTTGMLNGMLAGACFGAAAALKLSHAPVALALCIATPLLGSTLRERGRHVAAVAIGAMAAFAIVAGPWMFHLWSQWGNPMFPFFQAWFPGDWISPDSVRDLRYVPQTAMQVLVRPFASVLDWRSTGDTRFRDLRPLLQWVALVVCLFRWRQIAAPTRMLVVAFLIGWAMWVAAFGYYRYFVLFDLISAVVLLSVVAPAWQHRILWVLGATILTTDPLSYDRARHNWSAGKPLAIPTGTISPNTLVVLTGDRPTAFVLPHLPAFAAAVRVHANLLGPDRRAPGLERLIRARLEAHRGPLALLVQETDPAIATRALTPYGLRMLPRTCTVVGDLLLPLHDPPIRICLLERVRPAAIGAESVQRQDSAGVRQESEPSTSGRH